MSTVPIFFEGDPSGQARDVPFEQMHDALQHQGKLGIYMKFKDDPSGQKRVVPADQVPDAAQHGGIPVPIEEQPSQHPGFWASAGADIGGMAKGLWHSAVDPLTDTHEDLVRKSHEERAADAAAEQSPERNAHGALYKHVTVPLAEAVGVNVPGMEQSAAEGDTGGVMGHAAAPLAVMAASEVLARGGPVIAKKGARVVRAVVPGINKGLAKAPGTIGGLTGAAVGGYFGGHVGAEIGGAAGALVGKELLPKVRIPGEGAGLPGRVEGGPKVAPRFEDLPAPAVHQAIQELGTKAPLAKVAERAANIAKLGDLLNEGLGVKKLEPNVPLKNQGGVMTPKAENLPEGHTPVESSALKSYKYNPDAQEFEAVTQNGQHYIHGDVSPEEAAKFESADSKGKAWNELRKNSTPVAKVINGKRVPIRPVISEEDMIPQDEWEAGHELETEVEGSPR